MSEIEIKPVAGRIGAEIRGVDLSGNLDDNLIAEIRKTLVQYKAIFLRNQNLDAEGQVAFAHRFGTLTGAHPTMQAHLAERPEVYDLDYGKTVNNANVWHTDVTFVDRPPFGSILRAVVIPPYGGDTVWANTAAAYQDLPSHLRSFAEQLWAVHSNTSYQAVTETDSEEVKARRAIFESTVYETVHPVVRVHPESGERALLLGGFARSIQGLSQSESNDILRLLHGYVIRPENTVRWRWQEGDVAFWDNRATQHYAIADYGNQPRRVQRVTIAGEVPVNIEGQSGEVIKGDSSAYLGAEVLAGRGN